MLVWIVAASAAWPSEPGVDLAPLLEQPAADSELDDYPHYREHVLRTFRGKSDSTRPLDVDPYVADVLGASVGPSLELRPDEVAEFFDACARDQLTILRGIALVARAVRTTGVLAYPNGRDAVEHLHLSVGLALPMKHMLLFAYVPIDEPASPDVQCRFVAVYGAAYEHRFSRQVLDATLKIGSGRTSPSLSQWTRTRRSGRATSSKGRSCTGMLAWATWTFAALAAESAACLERSSGSLLPPGRDQWDGRSGWRPVRERDSQPARRRLRGNAPLRRASEQRLPRESPVDVPPMMTA